MSILSYETRLLTGMSIAINSSMQGFDPLARPRGLSVLPYVAELPIHPGDAYESKEGLGSPAKSDAGLRPGCLAQVTRE